MSSNHVQVWLRTIRVSGSFGVVALIMACMPAAIGHAASGDNFSVQVSPSPLVANPAPGEIQTATLTIRNFSNHSETLRAGLSGLTIEDNGRKVSPRGPIPGNMDAWVTFGQPQITIGPGATAPLRITFAPPQNVGFSYAGVVTLTSTGTATQQATGATIQPEVDVFCLVNINRSDAASKLSINSFHGNKSRYAFLPADFDVSVKNEGNIIAQPTGNIFIQRSFDDATPLAALPLNAGGGYVLPGTSRSFQSQWTAGFPSYISSHGQVHLHWGWKHVSELRLGRYVAKAVVVYNNGRQDVPLITSFTFWVIPWWLVTLVLVLGIVLVMGVVGWGWLIFRGTKKVKGYAANAHHKK